MITGGTISYGETRKIADYESKTAKVELSFAVEEGTDYAAAIEHVSALAKAKLHDMLFGAATAKPAQSPHTPVADDAAVVPKRRPGRPVGSTSKVELVPKGPSEPVNFTPPPAVEQEAAFVEEAKAEAAAPKPVEQPKITDAELTKGISDTMARIKDANRIRETAYKYGVQKGQMMSTMPHEHRHAFMAELSSLNAKAA